MKIIHMAIKGLVCVCLLATGASHAATISGQVSYLGGVLGTWSVNLTSSDPQVQLQKVVITLPATYGFDTQAGGFGLLLSQDFLKVSGGAGVTGVALGTPSTRDGASQVGINFSGFTSAAGAYTFLLDVDGAAPTLATCSGTFLQIAVCNVANGLLTTAASSVDASEIAGASVGFTFGGAGYDPTTVSAILSSTGGLLGQGAQGTLEGQIVPEPTTYALMGAGLVALAFLRCRRS